MKLIPTSTQPVTITLYQGIPFDNNYSEHTLLSTKFRYRPHPTSATGWQNVGSDKEAFINMQQNNAYVYPRTIKSGTYNFAFGNGLVTSVVMELTDNEINSNYMKVTSGTDNYYYFITGVTQKNEITYLLNLELDVFMTFGDEFLTNISGKPVMIERKHCRRVLENRRTLRPVPNKVCINQESMFNGIKPSIVKSYRNLYPKNLKQYDSEGEEWLYEFGQMNWAYIIYSAEDEIGAYTENGIAYPYRIYVLPLFNITFKFGNESWDYNGYNDYQWYLGDPKTLKIIISPFPPFDEIGNFEIRLTSVSSKRVRTYSWEVNLYDRQASQNHYTYTFSNINSGHYYDHPIQLQLDIVNTINGHTKLEILSGFGGVFEYEDVENYFTYTSQTEISITQPRDTNEFKLMISPFKEIKMSSFYGEELHIPTELLFDNPYIDSDYNKFTPITIASSNAEVNSYYNTTNINRSLLAKRGLSNSVAYNLPTTQDAMEVFNLTARNQFETAKSNATLSNGFKMISSVGNAGIVRSEKAVSGMITGVGSGIIGEIQNIENYNAKLEDLANTPDKYSFGGSSFAYDYAIANSSENNTLFPFLITYTCDPTRLEMASEFLYNYGYEYNRDGYFETDITLETDNVFERRLFNYIKIREDITSKIVGSNLPLVVAKKINEVLNAGIKLWTFHAFSFTTSSSVTYILRDYFQKNEYCNAELNTSTRV